MGGPPVVRDVLLLHEPDARAARALEGARLRQVQDGPGVPAPEAPRREGRPLAPAGHGRQAHGAEQGAERLRRHPDQRAVQAGHVPLLSVESGRLFFWDLPSWSGMTFGRSLGRTCDRRSSGKTFEDAAESSGYEYGGRAWRAHIGTSMNPVGALSVFYWRVPFFLRVTLHPAATKRPQEHHQTDE